MLESHRSVHVSADNSKSIETHGKSIETDHTVSKKYITSILVDENTIQKETHRISGLISETPRDQRLELLDFVNKVPNNLLCVKQSTGKVKPLILTGEELQKYQCFLPPSATVKKKSTRNGGNATISPRYDSVERPVMNCRYRNTIDTVNKIKQI